MKSYLELAFVPLTILVTLTLIATSGEASPEGGVRVRKKVEVGQTRHRESALRDPDDHIARAATVLLDKQIRLLPVVKDGKLVGTVSRADLCRAIVGTL